MRWRQLSLQQFKDAHLCLWCLVAALSALDSIEHVVRQLVSFRVRYAALVMAGDVGELDAAVV